MPQQPKRLPGEKNPEPNRDAVDKVAREAWMNQPNRMGDGDYGIARGITALLAWRKRRRFGRRKGARTSNTLLGQ